MTRVRRRAAARVLASVHARGAGAWLRVRRRNRRRRSPAESWSTALADLPADWAGHGGRPQRGIQRAEPDLRPRDRSRSTSPIVRCRRADCLFRMRGRSPSSPMPSRSRSRGSSRPAGRHECFWIVAGRDRHHVPLLRARPSAPSGCGIWANVTIAIPRGVLLKVAGWSAVKTVIGTRAVVHRGNLRSVSARRVDDQGLRRHGRRCARWMPHAADHLRRSPRGVDDLAVVHCSRS